MSNTRFPRPRRLLLAKLAVISAVLVSTLSAIPASAGPGYLSSIQLNGHTNAVEIDTSTARGFVNESGNSTGGVWVIDLVTEKVITRITVDREPEDLALNSATKMLYVVHGGNPGTVSVIDTGTYRVVDQISTGHDPSTVAVNPVTNHIYVSNYSDHTVSVIDGALGEVVATIELIPGQESFPQDMAVNSVTNRVYVNCGYFVNYIYARHICVIDGASNAVIAKIDTLGSSTSLAVDEARNAVYIGDFGWNKVFKVDGGTNQIEATIPTAGSPQGIAYNPSTDRIYVSTDGPSGSELSGRLVSIDGSTFTKLEETVVGGVPLGVGVYAPSYRIFVVETFSANLLALTEDALPPVSNLNLQNGNTVSRGQAITGSITDDFSGVAKVVVTFSQGAINTKVSAALDCTADKRSCTWSTTAPALPGPYMVQVQGTDAAGSQEIQGPAISQKCVNSVFLYGCVGEPRPPGPYALITVT